MDVGNLTTSSDGSGGLDEFERKNTYVLLDLQMPCFLDGFF